MLRFLVDELSFPFEQIIIGGFSIGTGAAASLAHRLWHQYHIQVAGLFLQRQATTWSYLPALLIQQC